MLQIKCPHCPTISQISESLAGKTVRCGQCQKIFTIEPVIDLPITGNPDAAIESESLTPEHSADAGAAKNADDNFLKRLFDDPETKGIVIFSAIIISIIALGSLWFLFGYIVPLATLAAAGVAYGIFVWIKKDASTDTLKFCPSCGTKWNAADHQCQRCTWDYRTQQYADPAKALLAKQRKPAPESSAPGEKSAADQFEIQELTKNCPFCGERILEVARVCKHCHSDLVSLQGPSAASAIAPERHAHYPEYRNGRGQNDDTRPATSVCTTLGFIFSVISIVFCPPLFGLAGFICAIIGLVQSRNKGYPIFVLLLSLALPPIGMLFGALLLTSLSRH